MAPMKIDSPPRLRRGCWSEGPGGGGWKLSTKAALQPSTALNQPGRKPRGGGGPRSAGGGGVAKCDVRLPSSRKRLRTPPTAAAACCPPLLIQGGEPCHFIERGAAP